MAECCEETESTETNVYQFKDELTSPDPIHEYPDSLLDCHAPLIIDNGAYKCRVGWATDDEPRLIFKNVIAKQRGKKFSAKLLYEMYLYPFLRSYLSKVHFTCIRMKNPSPCADADKPPAMFDSEIQIGNDISNIEVVRWQLKTQFDRNVVTHYDVQENVFDYIFNHLGITSSECVDHPIVLTEPVCNPNYCRQQMSELLFECYHVPQVSYGIDSLFSLYNNYPNPDVADSLVLSCGYNTLHVMPVLGGQLQAGHTRRINMGGLQVDSFMQRLLQLKYPGHFAAITLSRAEELVREHCNLSVDYQRELARWAEEDYYMDNVHIMQLPHVPLPVTSTNPDQQKERREQQIKRLRDINAKRREEKLAADQEKLQQLLSLLELADDDDDSYRRSLRDLGFSDTMELQMTINKLNNAINKLNNKILSEDSEAPANDSPSSSRKRGLKDDKKQKSLLQQFGDLKDKDMDSWLANIRKQRQELLDSRAARKQKRADMARRRTFASQQRMKIITELAQGNKRKKKKEDTFGQNDDDWNVYKQINRDGGDSDSEAEQEKLEEYETILREYDPTFSDGGQQPMSPIDLKEYYRLYVGVERIRIPELLFQPSMMGMDQAGLAETIDFVLRKFSPEDQNKLAQHVFITGGCAMFNNFRERLEQELLALRPFRSEFRVHTAANPVLDAWYGARRWSLTPQLAQYCITRAEYEEKGGEYLKEHMASNRYFPTPGGASVSTSASSSRGGSETPVDAALQVATPTGPEVTVVTS